MKIRLIGLMSGEQILSEVYLWGRDGSSDMELLNPIILVPTLEQLCGEDGNINYVPWCPLADKKSTVHVKHRNILYITTPNEKLIRNYLKETLHYLKEEGLI